MTGRGASQSGPSRKSIEWGTASSGRWALFLVKGPGCSHGRKKRLPAFFTSRDRWSWA